MTRPVRSTASPTTGKFADAASGAPGFVPGRRGSGLWRLSIFRFLAIALGSAAILITSDVLAAPDIEAGRIKAKPCNTCHGRDGIGTLPMFPNLAGQKATYLEKQLKDFRSGIRKSEVMKIVVKNLSDQDIKDLAAYFESLPPGGAKD